MTRILITGVSGTGKSTVCKKITELGYEATDIENVDGLFKMYHKGTKEIFEGYDNANPENIKNAVWLCNVNKLKNFLGVQKTDVAFYGGIASNMDEIVPLFDKVFVLQPSMVALNLRLKNREGTDDIGNNQEGRNVVLGWKDWWESEMQKKGSIFINANGSPQNIAEKILKILDIPRL